MASGLPSRAIVRTLRPVLSVALVLCLAGAAAAQPPAPAPPDPDVPVDPLQPDFTLAALPTTLRVAAGRSAFRVTHRFTRALNQGDLGDLLANAFGLDSSALVGLEFRFGLRPGTQVGVHRTSDRAIQLFARQNIRPGRAGDPLGLDVFVTFEGEDNLSARHQSAIGLVLSRRAGPAALYVEPIAVLNSSPFDDGPRHTAFVGLGSRVRVASRVYLVAEFSPRLGGYRPGVHQFSAAVERRTGGHNFQLNVSNGFGTTFGQLARGGVAYDRWYLGFNISRKFY